MKLTLINLMIKYYTKRKKIDDKIVEILKIKRYAVQAEIDIKNIRNRKDEKREI